MENIVTEEAIEWPCRYSERVLKKKKEAEGEIEGSQISFFSCSFEQKQQHEELCEANLYIIPLTGKGTDRQFTAFYGALQWQHKTLISVMNVCVCAIRTKGSQNEKGRS